MIENLIREGWKKPSQVKSSRAMMSALPKNRGKTVIDLRKSLKT